MEQKGTIKWGVLGTGNIVNKAGRGLQLSQHGVWHGVAGRNRENGEACAAKFGVPTVYDDYQGLIDDPEIDAVYIALLNHLHMEWAIKACRAGKHVLVEKPFAMDLAEAKHIHDAAAASGVTVAEAFVWRFHPAYAILKRHIVEGRIGEVQQFIGYFSFVATKSSTRWKKEWGGGALYDIGCYPVSWSRFFMVAEPETVDAWAVWDEAEQVDRRLAATLYYPGGRFAQISCAFDMGVGTGFDILGTTGRISIRINVTPETMTIESLTNGTDRQEWPMSRFQMFAQQADSFVESFRDGTTQPNSVGDALQQARILDAMFTAARSGQRTPI
ncbi:MAG: oxidoreductase [Paenibacillaceae bacterium]|nr:oxidoreductase [Paenibacillaceae bacterium]